MAKKRKTKKRSTSKKKPTRTRRARGGLKSASLSELQAEIERRARTVEKLSRRRDELLRELMQIDQELRNSGVTPGGVRRGPGRPPKVAGLNSISMGVRRRPRNTTNLVDALHKVLQNKTMSVTEVSEAVQKAGYHTTSENFRTIVNQALIGNTDRFKKVARGQYTAK